MPCLKIFTNIVKDKIPENFVQKIIPVLSKTVRKPENQFIVMVSPGCPLTFGGKSTSTTGAVATLESIGNLGVEENRIIAKEVTDFVHNELGIAPDHFFLSFYDIRGQDIAYNGVTFA